MRRFLPLVCLLVAGCAMKTPTAEQQNRWEAFLRSGSVPAKNLLATGQLETWNGERRLSSLNIWGEGETRLRVVLRDMKDNLVIALDESRERIAVTMPDGSISERAREDVYGSLTPISNIDFFRMLQGDYVGPFVPYEQAECGKNGGYAVEARNGARGELFLDEKGRPQRLLVSNREIVFQYGEELTGARITRDGKPENAVSFHNVEQIFRELTPTDYMTLQPPSPVKEKPAMKKRKKKK